MRHGFPPMSSKGRSIFSISFSLPLSSPRHALVFRTFARRLLQVAPVTHIYPQGKERFAAHGRYFLHARTCRNKGRPGKGRVGHEGTPDSRGVAPRKWIQLNSHTRRARLSQAETFALACVRMRYRREVLRRERPGRDVGMWGWSRDKPRANVFIHETFCKRNSTSRKFRRCQSGETISTCQPRNGCAMVGFEVTVVATRREKEVALPTGNDFAPGTH